MPWLSDILAKSTESGITMPWPSLGSLKLLPGTLSIVLGQPTVGKSALALNIAMRMVTGIGDRKCSSVILSLDTALQEQAVRLTALITCRETSQIRKSPASWVRVARRAEPSRVRMYDSVTDMRDIEALLVAEEEFSGRKPDLLVVDNVGNLVTEQSYEQYRQKFADLLRIARRTNVHVMGLHHVNRGMQGVLPTLFGGNFAGEQDPEVVLGLGVPKGNRMNLHPPKKVLRVAILKNRSGLADPHGSVYADLVFDASRMSIKEPDMLQQVLSGFASVTA